MIITPMMLILIIIIVSHAYTIYMFMNAVPGEGAGMREPYELVGAAQVGLGDAGQDPRAEEVVALASRDREPLVGPQSSDAAPPHQEVPQPLPRQRPARARQLLVDRQAHVDERPHTHTHTPTINHR